MDTCPICGGEMPAGCWEERVPPIAMPGGAYIRFPPTQNAPAQVCPACSLFRMAPETIAAPAQLTGRVECAVCGAPAVEGTLVDRLPDLLANDGRRVRASRSGSLACTACPNCGVVRLLGSSLRVQSARAAALHVNIRAKARAERVIGRCMAIAMVPFGLLGAATLWFARFPLPFVTWEEGVLIHMAVFLAVGALIGLGVGLLICRARHLPPPWHRRD